MNFLAAKLGVALKNVDIQFYFELIETFDLDLVELELNRLVVQSLPVTQAAVSFDARPQQLAFGGSFEPNSRPAGPLVAPVGYWSKRPQKDL